MAIVDCPVCHHQIEQPEDTLSAGVKCPGCGTGFMPADYRTANVPPSPALPIQKKSHPVRSYAATMHGLAIFLVVLAGLMMIAGIFIESQMHPERREALTWASAFLGTAFFTECFAQLLFIRAAVEDIARK